MRISDWSSDVCSSDLRRAPLPRRSECRGDDVLHHLFGQRGRIDDHRVDPARLGDQRQDRALLIGEQRLRDAPRGAGRAGEGDRSEEHTSELQSLMRISYAVFCLKKKTTTTASYT